MTRASSISIAWNCSSSHFRATSTYGASADRDSLDDVGAPSSGATSSRTARDRNHRPGSYPISPLRHRQSPGRSSHSANTANRFLVTHWPIYPRKCPPRPKVRKGQRECHDRAQRRAGRDHRKAGRDGEHVIRRRLDLERVFPLSEEPSPVLAPATGGQRSHRHFPKRVSSGTWSNRGSSAPCRRSPCR